MKKIFIFSGFLVLFAGQVFAQSFYSNFINAYMANDFQNCIKHGNELVKLSGDPDTLYKVSQCYSENNQPDESLKILNRLADLGLTYKISDNAKLQKLKGEKTYKNLLDKFEKNLRPINKSENAFTLSDNNLIPEGIASVSDGSRFYVGSLAKNKIVEYSAVQGEKNFIKSNQDGIWSVVGMKISPNGQEIWACSFTESGEYAGYAGVFGFELRTGKLIAKYVSDNKSGQHLFNDLVISKNGQIYFTDSRAGKVLSINRATKQIESNFNREFIYPNGIALNEKEDALFVADFAGITRIDLKTGNIVPMNSGNLTYLQNIDGLYFYDGSLIAVQGPGGGAERIARFYLNKSQTKVSGVKILQSFHQGFDPTTGTIAGDDFYYIDNSYVGNLKPDGTITDADKLKKPLIKKINLKVASK